MFWFRHPKPFHRKEVAVQMASRQIAPPPGTTSITLEDMPPGMPALNAGGVAADDDSAIRFSVRYRLPEYLVFVHEHVRSTIRTGATFNLRRHMTISLALSALLALLALASHAFAAPALAWWSGMGALLALLCAACNTGPGLKLQLIVFCTPVFLVKRHYMPECCFSIDAGGVERVTKRGTMTLGWDDIVAVRTCSLGYILMTKSGGTPIPFRCLGAAQAARLRALVAAHRARLSLTANVWTRDDTMSGNTAPA